MTAEMRGPGDRAPPARRIASCARSYVCFGPIIPVGFVRERLGACLDIAWYEQAVARAGHWRYWPETNVGASAARDAPRGRRSI